jgi:acetyl-CoA C-acetyltransferase
MEEAFIYDTLRTPRGKGKPDGSLHEIRPITLLVTALNAIKERNNLDTSEVEDVIVGCVTQIGDQGADIAKLAAIAAGYANTVSGITLNRFCSSGLEAINFAAAQIMSGQEDLIIAGGVESMSRVKIGSDGGAVYNPDFIMNTNFVPQGISADLMATKDGYTRLELDQFAAASHAKAELAWKENRFNKSIIPVKDINGLTILDRDETIRPGTSAETLAKLKPSFEQMGTLGGFDNIALNKYPEIERMGHFHHAGNSSGIVDGASLTLIGNKSIGERLGLKARAKIKSWGVIGTEPTIMLIGPAPSARKALRKAKMEIGDIDLFEVNEAFAVVPMRFMDEMNIDHSIVNVNGGAIAMGHPLGATGSMIFGTLLDELERQNKSTGLATLCVGGGMGVATIIERV